MTVFGIEEYISELLRDQGCEKIDFKIEPLTISGNNRVFILHTNTNKFVVKWYFNDTLDSRDRLDSEYSFLEYAWSTGLRCIPRPIAKLKSKFIAMYEFIEGQRIQSSPISDIMVEQAARFLAEVNRERRSNKASQLPLASEACFNIFDHINMVDQRLSKLNHIPILSDIDESASKFIRNIEYLWTDIKNNLLNNCQKFKINPHLNLSIEDRCLSPSDFGFHNTLLSANEKIFFLDFEYAGWDDPAKTIGDFFLHPNLAVPRSMLDSFISQAFIYHNNSEQITLRINLLEPIFQVKWCCIILNEFLPLGAKRRKFANPFGDINIRKAHQLEKARKFSEIIQHS